MSKIYFISACTHLKVLCVCVTKQNDCVLISWLTLHFPDRVPCRGEKAVKV